MLKNIHHLKLISDVQVGERFIEQDDGRLLCHGAGNHHALHLATAQLGEHPVAVVGKTGELEHLLHHLNIVRGGGFPAALVRVATHQHGVEHREVEHHILPLRHVSHQPRFLHRRQRVKRLSAHLHRATLRLQKTRHQLQQRGLSRTVRSHNRTKIPLIQFKGETVKQMFLRIGKFQFLNINHSGGMQFAKIQTKALSPFSFHKKIIILHHCKKTTIFAKRIIDIFN